MIIYVYLFDALVFSGNSTGTSNFHTTSTTNGRRGKLFIEDDDPRDLLDGLVETKMITNNGIVDLICTNTFFIFKIYVTAIMILRRNIFVPI